MSEQITDLFYLGFRSGTTQSRVVILQTRTSTNHAGRNR